MGVLFNDVVINKLSGGLGRRTPDQDMVSGLLFNGLDTSELEDEKLHRLASLDDAKALGINQDYDSGGESAYYQISQFFRMNPSGDLFLYKNKDATSFADLVSKAETMLLQANGEIRQLAVTYNKDITFDQTLNAVAAAKTITDAAFDNHRPVEIIIEGKGFDASKSPADLRGYGASNVSVMVAMDTEKAKEDTYSNTAAVGVLLGAISRAKVSENIAWIEKFNLTGEGFRSVGFIRGKELPTEGAQKTLDQNKYIFTRTHIGIAGIYFNDSHTCTEPTSDFTYIEANRTINKAARIARASLLPKVNAPVLVDPELGTLPPSVVKGYETLCRSALERMVANGEASEIDVYVDPSQNILSSSLLQVKIEVIPTGTARRIEVNLGFKNPFGLTTA
ncbi:DUF2586 domain-containing protein [Aquimarina gracilis]|uniref:DUF2586 domain-containing protein n=1 Tax=Aquimarina gracilis TaxID=874422 RepID=A0ABU5ZXC9_9FLAO|nr:DUF2586 domain-containing protein [Aquimarina gracilis]MEB3346526.1 DUF2586 domain-containing protein [Aquimarina gracilis]